MRERGILIGMADFENEQHHPSPSRRAGLLARARSFYARIERPFSSISLIGGFVFDAVTLTRVDEFWENFWVIAHLAIVTICALVINLIENTPGDEEDPAKLHFWLVNIMQFFFGGIFSTYLVFYFRGGSILQSWPFLAILAAAFIANERFKRHYARLVFQIALLFLSYYAFAIYLLPIIFHRMGTDVFLWSGVAAIVAIGLLITALRAFSHERFVGKAKWYSRAAVAGILITMNALYFANLIPPLPLSLKDAGIYQSFKVNGPGNYTAQAESQPWWSYFEWSPTIHVAPGTPLTAYTAVFAPTALNTQIVHEWQYYNPTTKGWVLQERIPLPVSGGGSHGWRTFSRIPSVVPGDWRVNVRTTNGALIGQLRFTVATASSTPSLTTTIID